MSASSLISGIRGNSASIPVGSGVGNVDGGGFRCFLSICHRRKFSRMSRRPRRCSGLRSSWDSLTPGISSNFSFRGKTTRATAWKINDFLNTQDTRKDVVTLSYKVYLKNGVAFIVSNEKSELTMAISVDSAAKKYSFFAPMTTACTTLQIQEKLQSLEEPRDNTG